jgi:hypothetical protein
LGWQATPRTLPVPPLTYWEGSQKEQGRKNAGARRRNWHVIDALLVEDSPDYARLIQETFRDVNANVNFHMVSEGEEAMDFLVHPGAANHARTKSFWIWACLEWMAVKFRLNSRHLTTGRAFLRWC